MAVTAFVYTNAAKAFVNGTISWKASGGSAFKCALLTSSYTPDQDADEFWDDISANEVSGDGYSAGGASMTTADPTVDTGTNETRMDANDVSWSDSTITARYAVVYYASGTPATSNLVACINFGEDKISSTGTFTITWAATGVFKITAS